MIVFAREVFVCKTPTGAHFSETEPSAELSDVAQSLRFVRGGVADLAKLDPEHHNSEHVEDFRARLRRGEHWMIGFSGDRIMTYTWLHTRSMCEYPYLPGCRFALSADTGYGYDAWTPPNLRGGGLRRRAFVEELRILHDKGMKWEASYFVKHQLEGASRSLAKVGIEIVPLWRVTLQRDRTLSAENLAPGDETTKPAF
jgi:hypothetical protein